MTKQRTIEFVVAGIAMMGMGFTWATIGRGGPETDPVGFFGSSLLAGLGTALFIYGFIYGFLARGGEQG